jgi:hypothetical protein
MATITTDKPGVDASTFSASLVETPGLDHSLTVSGEAVGDYRVQQITLVRATHQASKQTLALDIHATLGPVENPHPQIERVFPLQYKETPAAHPYTHVLIRNHDQHFTIAVTDIL